MAARDVVNPATEEIITSVPAVDAAGTDAAVARARTAFPGWRDLAPGDRARVLRRFAEAVDGDREHLAALEVANSGHTIGNARWEAGNVRDVIAYYSGSPERLAGQQIPVAGGVDVTFHEPMGVIGAIVPWNFPMPIASWAFAPALAAGNCVVLKPAELTPLTALRLAELALAAGIPEDVFQVIPGRGAVVGERLVDHPDVAKIVFTGSTEVGATVMAGCARQIKPVTLELGGKSANIVFADADVAAAAASAPYAVFDNAGQDCCARSRILVQRSCFDRFMEEFEAAVRGVVVADPDRRALRDGAADQRGAPGAGGVLRGRRRGVPRFGAGRAGLLVPAHGTDAERPHRPGAARGDLRAGRRGRPLRRGGRRRADRQRQRVRPLRLDLDPRPRRALRVSRAVEAGNLSVNSHSSVRYWTPFGGYKSSGLGRELGPDAPLAFTETKNVFIATD